jgi:hypothetical protein
MPKNLRADIEWHKARIAFYTQALEELALDKSAPKAARLARMEGMQTIIADLRRTLADLEKTLAALEVRRP